MVHTMGFFVGCALPRGAPEVRPRLFPLFGTVPSLPACPIIYTRSAWTPPSNSVVRCLPMHGEAFLALVFSHACESREYIGESIWALVSWWSPRDLLAVATVLVLVVLVIGVDVVVLAVKVVLVVVAVTAVLVLYVWFGDPHWHRLRF